VTSNADTVLDQFTRQATPFVNSAAMRDEEPTPQLTGNSPSE